MSEQTDAPQGGTEGVDAPEAVETNPEATTGQPEAGADNPETADDAGDEAEEPKRKHWAYKRIDELTAKRYEAEREAAYWRGKAETSAPDQQPAKQPEALVRPTLEQFDYDDAAYGAAMDQYVEKRAEQAAERALEKRSEAKTFQSRIETAQSRLAQGAAKHPDFEALVSDIPATEAVQDLLVSDESAADILYELAKSGDLEAFNRLTPIQQAVQLGKISARISTPSQAQPKTIAPPPPQTVAGLSAGMNKPAEQMSPAEFNAWRESGGGR